MELTKYSTSFSNLLLIDDFTQSDLQKIRDSYNYHEHKDAPKESKGGYNFILTLKVIGERCGSDKELCYKMYQILDHISSWTYAGSISWELRKFLRRANYTQSSDFIILIHSIIQTTTDTTIFDGMDMDRVLWDPNEEIPQYIKMLKDKLNRLRPNDKHVQEIFGLLKTI